MKDNIDRGLILIYKSSNAHQMVSFAFSNAELLDFCSSPEKKEELIFTLNLLMKNIENNC